MMDGRFDQQFAELFAASRADTDSKEKLPAVWPLALACIAVLTIDFAKYQSCVSFSSGWFRKKSARLLRRVQHTLMNQSVQSEVPSFGTPATYSSGLSVRKPSASEE